MRKVIILRGLPGSGKSTIADLLTLPQLLVCMDDYWASPDRGVGPEGTYNDTELQAAIQWARNKFSLLVGDPLAHTIVVDNTGTRLFEYAWFRNRAIENGLSVHIVHVEATIQECVERQIHGVPLGKVLDMRDRWEPVASKDPDRRIRELEEAAYASITKCWQRPIPATKAPGGQCGQ